MKKRKNWIPIASFFIPIVIVLIMFSAMGLFPFENNGKSKTLLIYDLWVQYFPIFVENYDNIREGGSAFWSWDGALGFNVFAQDAYYTHSVFNLLFLPFSQGMLEAVYHFSIVLKYGFAALTFSIFLTYKYKKPDLVTVAFSVVYAFCGYMLAFISQPIWMDVVIITPLVIMGLERMIMERKPIMYVATLFLAIFFNYYIAFALCIFLVLYCVTFLVAKSDILGKKAVGKGVFLFVIFSAAAGALAAFEILPLQEALSQTISADTDMPTKPDMLQTFTQYFAKLIPGTKFTLVWEAPNIFSGIISLILVPLFFFNRKFSLRKKISVGVLIGVLYLSMNNNILMRVWHGFHYPNQLNGRWTYLFSFVLICLAYEAFRNIKYVDKRGIIGSVFIVAVIIAGARANAANPAYAVSKVTATVTLIVAIVYAALFLFIKKTNGVSRKILTLSVAVLIIVEMGANTVHSFTRKDLNDSKKYLNYNLTTYDTFSSYNKQMDSVNSVIPRNENDFYRQELFTRGTTFNPGQLYNFRGITYYASNMPESSYNLFKSLGNEVYTANISTVYNPQYAVLNTMFNIKYIVDIENRVNEVPYSYTDPSGAVYQDSKYPYGYELFHDGGNFQVYENKYYLPVAFAVDNNMANWNNFVEFEPISNQNNFVNAAYGEELNPYSKVAEKQILFTNMEVKTGKELGLTDDKVYYRKIDGNQEMLSADYKYTVQKSGNYVVQNGMKTGIIGVIVNGMNTITQKVSENTPLLNVGHLQAGDELVVHFEVSGYNVGLFKLDTFLLDEEKIGQMQSKFGQEAAEIITATDTALSMKLQTAENNQLVYTSIPADKGWTVKVNGKKIATSKIAGSLLAFTVPLAGNNRIDIEYSLPGFAPGLLISIVTFLLLVLFVLTRKFKLGTKTGNKILKSFEYFQPVGLPEPPKNDILIDTSFRDFEFSSNVEIEFEKPLADVEDEESEVTEENVDSSENIDSENSENSENTSETTDIPDNENDNVETDDTSKK